ncbi:grpE protein homolog 2, mitochondrial-like isoform X1 [Humulus lupulus]|uniref:grpE protein homolog 2, mitochondrial-like isoform X1 n=1 Tax=Humulus lupulus TaxID=3486 RepID=UPI002B40E42D|nr:grpE protein homolog 2, mitochondrial-like isoform X1 [Humulus lupulus]
MRGLRDFRFLQRRIEDWLSKKIVAFFFNIFSYCSSPRRTIPRSSLLLSSPQTNHLSNLSNQFHSLVNESSIKLAPGQVSLFHLSSSPFQRFGFASSASPKTSEKEHWSNSENNGDAKVSSQAASKQSDVADQTKESGSISDSQSTMSNNVKTRRRTKRAAFSDSNSDEDLSVDDLVKLVAEKEELLKQKHKEIEKMKDKVLRSYAKMENVMDRTRREAENSKKFAIQVWYQSLFAYTSYFHIKVSLFKIVGLVRLLKS